MDILENQIKIAISEYLEFDSDDLFKNRSNLVKIFGGCIRDIIAGQKINDVDILCGSDAISYIEFILSKNSYIHMDSLQPIDLSVLYRDIKVINEIHTWVKGTKIVQLIRPTANSKVSSKEYNQIFNDLVYNVDISCCGISYDGIRINEDFPNSILHAKMKVFSVNICAKMYSGSRTSLRTYKLEERGWKKIENTKEVNRDLKIANTLDI